MTIAENIKEYMTRMGIMQNVVAEKAGMRPDSFSSAMNGKRKITIDEYIRICAALEKPVTEFVPQEYQTQAAASRAEQ